jgi:hypothetical protein
MTTHLQLQKLARTCFDILRKYFACYLVSVKSFENRNFSADAITLTEKKEAVYF